MLITYFYSFVSIFYSYKVFCCFFTDISKKMIVMVKFLAQFPLFLWGENLMVPSCTSLSKYKHV
jgi:hypothetical protein